MGEISAVVVLTEYLTEDLRADVFDSVAQERILSDIDELEEHLTTWGRDLTDATTVLTTPAGETIYRRQVGDFRTYFARQGDTLYCIGAGKRATTYDRDLGMMRQRADSIG